MKKLKNLFEIGIIILLFISCKETTKYKREQLKKTHEKEKFKSDSIEKEQARKNGGYKFEYIQDRTTGICYSIYRTEITTHSGWKNYIVSHTCVPCQYAGFKEIPRIIIR